MDLPLNGLGLASSWRQELRAGSPGLGQAGNAWIAGLGTAAAAWARGLGAGDCRCFFLLSLRWGCHGGRGGAELRGSLTCRLAAGVGFLPVTMVSGPLPLKIESNC